MPGHSSTKFRDQAFLSLIQEYSITQKIGSGTFGQVFRAHRWNQSKEVAIKVYRPGRHGSVSSATVDEVDVGQISLLNCY
jgi:serine/threonine protein kinase